MDIWQKTDLKKYMPPFCLMYGIFANSRPVARIFHEGDLIRLAIVVLTSQNLDFTPHSSTEILILIHVVISFSLFNQNL